VKFHWQISAGELFELLRPLALVLSALLSTWVLASARRWRFRLATAVVWALGTFLFPFIVLPVYLIARSWTKRNTQPNSPVAGTPAGAGPSSLVRLRLLLPAIFGLILLSLIGIHIYRDYRTVDAHLARAAQAKVTNDRAKAIREYRAALKLEDNPHTHKLLGIELADAGDWAEALLEFRAAERSGEPDDSLPFRIARALEATGQRDEALREYEKFLASDGCNHAPPLEWCAIARQQIAGMQASPTPSRTQQY
jgi:hypothetical protein